ncbi:Uncharacterised protein [Klebsiella aerogenes]|nr:Uncharacterised protein [Klebsiella aerogenes]
MQHQRHASRFAYRLQPRMLYLRFTGVQAMHSAHRDGQHIDLRLLHKTFRVVDGSKTDIFGSHRFSIL